MITQERLKELLTYSPETGDFIWNYDIGNVKKGTVVKCKDSYGYITVGIDKKKYLSHRLAWLYMMGEFPKNCIDHINNLRDDNRFINLREATVSQNNKNKSISKRNTSGAKGVSFSKVKNKWTAHCSVNSRDRHIGDFLSLEDAKTAYINFAKKHHGEFYHG